ncbi:hypothetical protein EAE96_007894 [Botrytis aclada]|nr:hypothetical protein EAE96_007894 [Botrytis aclada]
MSSNNKTPIIPGRVRALTNQWQTGEPSNTQEADLSLLDALPDRNCSLAAPGPALAGAINRWENRHAPTPAPQSLQLSNALPDGNSQSLPSTAVVRVPSRLAGFAFTSLPAELRVMIWKELISEPQTIRITDNTMIHNRSHSRQNPAVLYVNHESRTEALKHLKRLFDGVNGNGHPEQFKYFNPSSDLIYFDGGATRLFEFPPTILPPVIDLSNEAPMVQADDVLYIQVDEDQVNEHGPAAYFRNLKYFGVQFTMSRLGGNHFIPQFAKDAADSQRFVRYIHGEMRLNTRFVRAWFQSRLSAGLISRVPRIEVLLTRANQRIVDSTGQYAVDYFHDNPF